MRFCQKVKKACTDTDAFVKSFLLYKKGPPPFFFNCFKPVWFFMLDSYIFEVR